MRMKLFSCALLLILSFLFSATLLPAAREPVAMATYYRNEGVVGAVRALRRAESGRRVLHVGAHPDDEDSALLAWLSFGQNARVSYLSLTRGEGGQNRIGPEKYADLGALRTAELLEAREIDGARQLFGRMIDFGFSKTGEEALRIWGRENIVEDMVRAIRMTRPHVVISRFKGDAADGHGQHQAVGMTIREAFERAADPDAFAEQLEQGLEPWRADKLYVMTFDKSPEVTLTIDTGEYDALSGRSYAAIGYRGRSMHRSQDMGMEEFERPTRPSYLIQVAPPPGEGSGAGLWDGAQIQMPVAADVIARVLAAPEWMTDPDKIAGAICEALSAYWKAAAPDRDVINDLNSALAMTLGIRVEAFSSASEYIEGEEVEFNLAFHARDPEKIEFRHWSVNPESGFHTGATAPSARIVAFFGEWACRSSPWFINGEDRGFLYPRSIFGDFESAPFDRIGDVLFHARHQGTNFSVRVPVEWRWADPAFGEIRSYPVVIPRTEVRFSPSQVFLRKGDNTPREVSIELNHRGSKPFDGRLEVYRVEDPERVAFGFDVQMPSNSRKRLNIALNGGAESSGELKARWREISGLDHDAMRVDRLDYRHIRPRTLVRPAALELHCVDVKLPENMSLAYVQGSGDEIPGVLRSLGLRVMELTDAELGSVDLSAYDAIALGIRAYETRPALLEHNARLLDYARGGGTLVVQYNKSEFAAMNVAPYPVTYSSPHDRVTDETAAVTALDPEHPVFRFPNKITAKDYEGWIQERGLYFWATWDERYQPLLDMADPGEAPKRGGLLIADYGKGKYIYTGLAFFRQIPAGVEGATKLFVNLLAAGKE